MTITLDLQPEVERELHAQAKARGVSLSVYMQEIIVREAQVMDPRREAREPANLVELFEPVRGLLTDEEVDTLFKRNRSFSRPVDF